MRFIQTTSGIYINVGHIKKLYWKRGYSRKTPEGYEHCFPSVNAVLFEGDNEELAFFDIGEAGNDEAKAYLDELVAKLNAEEI